MKFSSEDINEIIDKARTIFERIKPEKLNQRLDNYRIIKTDELVNSWMEQWCQVVAEGNWGDFEKRLGWDNLDINTVRNCLNSEELSDTEHSPNWLWLETLNEVIETASLVVLETLEDKTSENKSFLDSQPVLPFEEIFIPFIYVARRKLIAQTGSSYQLLSEEAIASLERSLLQRLCQISSPTLELQFSIFRACLQPKLTYLLKQSQGENSDKQYKKFVKKMLEGELITFFREYSVLARLMATVTDLWVDANTKFLLRLSSDYLEIQKKFSSEAYLGKVVVIQPQMADYHNNGCSVMVISFASGLRLIYKPKDLGLEQVYFGLLSWLNEKNFSLPFKIIKVLNCSTYGWVEFVETLPCKDEQEAKRHYQRCGVLLCLVYVLGGTDFHNENLIACGEHPILVDLETLMYHRVLPEQTNNQTADDLAYRHLWTSVLYTGLLPRWHFGKEGDVFDGAAFSDSLQQGMIRSLIWKNVNLDNMERGYEFVPKEDNNNQPLLNGVALSAANYVEEIVNGFQEMYSFLISSQQFLLANDGPLKKFSHLRVRFIFRPTAIYSSLLLKTTHPKFLRNGIERSIELEALNKVLISDNLKPPVWDLVKLERQALENLDIPLFKIWSDSDTLDVDNGEVEKFEKFFTQSSYERVISNVKSLNENDLVQQIGIIKGTLYSHIASDSVHHSSQSENISLNEADEFEFVNSLTEELIEELIKEQAIAIATDIRKRGVYSADNSATWIAPQYVSKFQKYQFNPLNYGLYDGCCGVALFLAALEKVEIAGFRDLSLASIQTLRQAMKLPSSEQIAQEIGIGAAFGLGSIIYSFVRISQFLDLPELLQEAKNISDLITSECIAADQTFDITSGSAGAIVGLLALYNNLSDSEVLEKAINCGHHLLDNRKASDSGFRSWATVDKQLLTGFSHGAAGIAYALLRLYEITGETLFLESAKEVIDYENSVFINKLGNWPSFSSTQTTENVTCMCSWCHGAPGIGLARAAGLNILDTDRIRQDIEVAINTTKLHNLSDIDHLCCGNLGRVEFLFTASRKTSQPHLLEIAIKQAMQVVNRATQKDSLGYGLSLTFHPGFFQGASGIGYQLLRLAYPDQLPSVLLWE
jgi:type 2 lantibiotic biosynthesis protein LanM